MKTSFVGTGFHKSRFFRDTPIYTPWEGAKLVSFSKNLLKVKVKEVSRDIQNLHKILSINTIFNFSQTIFFSENYIKLHCNNEQFRFLAN